MSFDSAEFFLKRKAWAFFVFRVPAFRSICHCETRINLKQTMFGNDRILAPIGARREASFVWERFGLFNEETLLVDYAAQQIKASLCDISDSERAKQ